MSRSESALAQAGELERAGRLAEAGQLLATFLSASPGDTDAWYELARLQRRGNRHHEALASYAQALQRGAARPWEIHVNRGVIYADDLRDPDAARREFERALALEPRCVPAWLNLANLYEDLGDAVLARQAYEQLLAIEPAHAEALGRYAGMGRGDHDPVLDARLQTLLDSRDTDAAGRASLGFALGKRLDARGEYERAFAAYARANADSRESAGARAPRYDRHARERRIDAIIRAFDGSTPKPLPAPDRKPPVFICGMFRSGSTLLEQVLSRHPDVTAGGELSIVPELVKRYFSPFPDAVAGSTRLAEAARAGEAMMARLFPGAGTITDKRPDNYLNIGLIKTLYPDARIVHTMRHPLDNVLSIWFLHLDPRMAWALDLGDIAHQYGQYRRLMRHWRDLYGGDILDFDYDQFVAQPEGPLEGLLRFLGLPHADGMLDFAASPVAVRTASAWQVREPLYRRSSGRWRHYAAQLEAVHGALAGYL